MHDCGSTQVLWEGESLGPNLIYIVTFDSTLWAWFTQVLKPGGLLLFRDYGLYDHAMLRFGCGHKISTNFYVRQDGTRAYYFSEGI